MPLTKASLRLLMPLCWLFSMLASAQDCAGPDAERNLRRAQAFLEANKDADDVLTTESGLQYKVLEMGDGDTKPRSRGTAVAHYELFNVKGEKLEGTRERGAPFQFDVHRVIPGWQQAITDMVVGERRMLYVPPSLAYGCKGAGPKIGPNELLIFDMELLHIVR